MTHITCLKKNIMNLKIGGPLLLSPTIYQLLLPLPRMILVCILDHWYRKIMQSAWAKPIIYCWYKKLAGYIVYSQALKKWHQYENPVNWLDFSDTWVIEFFLFEFLPILGSSISGRDYMFWFGLVCNPLMRLATVVWHKMIWGKLLYIN